MNLQKLGLPTVAAVLGLAFVILLNDLILMQGKLPGPDTTNGVVPQEPHVAVESSLVGTSSPAAAYQSEKQSTSTSEVEVSVPEGLLIPSIESEISFKLGKAPIADMPTNFPLLSSSGAMQAYCLARTKTVVVKTSDGTTNHYPVGNSGDLQEILSIIRSNAAKVGTQTVVTDEDGNPTFAIKGEYPRYSLELPEVVSVRVEAARIAKFIPQGPPSKVIACGWHRSTNPKYISLDGSWIGERGYISLLSENFNALYTTDGTAIQ